MNEETMETVRAMIREVIAEQMGAKPLTVEKDPSGFAVIRGNECDLEHFDTGNPGDKVGYRQLLSVDESANLAFGFLDIEESSFDWFLGYDEVDYILRGTWEITIKGKKYVGYAGDTMFIPKNTAVTFSSPDHATVFYAAYPARWEELCEEQPA